MLLKYKDFKILSEDDMKQIRGGYNEPAWCRATALCNGGGSVTLTCPHAEAGCVANDYGSPGYSGNGSAYCSEGGVIQFALCGAH
jgi:hypothetical protein